MASRRPSGGRAPRTSRTRATPPSEPGIPTPRLQSLQESLEVVREDFDEACEHVIARREFTGFSLGPLTDIPMAQLSAGVIGWHRAVRWTPGSEQNGPTFDGDLYYLVVPGFDPDWSSPDAETPLRGFRWNDFLAAQESLGPPKSILVGRAKSEASRSLLTRFVQALQGELEAGD